MHMINKLAAYSQITINNLLSTNVKVLRYLTLDFNLYQLL